MYGSPGLLTAPASPGGLRCAPGSSVPPSGRGRVACIRPTSEGAETLGNCARWNAGCTVTTPGPRVLSVSDLAGRQRLDEEAPQKGLHKVAKKIDQLKAFARRATKGKKADLLSDVLSDYHPEHTAFPTLVESKHE